MNSVRDSPPAPPWPISALQALWRHGLSGLSGISGAWSGSRGRPPLVLLEAWKRGDSLSHYLGQSRPVITPCTQ